MRITLQDVSSGKLVVLRVAELKQYCPICCVEMQHRVIVHIEGDPRNWCCFEHLTVMLEGTKTDEEKEDHEAAVGVDERPGSNP